MERALSLWASGTDPTVNETGRKITPPAFGEMQWGPKTRVWTVNAYQLGPEQLAVITSEATTRANIPASTLARKGSEFSEGSIGDDSDPRRMLDICASQGVSPL